MLKIGVLLPARFSEAGDYLADARALDAAGVDSLWLRDDDFDPWLVLAGIAAVTGRARLAVSVS
ncbi:MAG TPA: LLM class flavin-dependent oxidoreductase, partial [Methylomirabilota bacterium]|nr:LLM class flavin-dependent oxidoreductase [Methylomirabilota bacterium]